MGEVMTVVNNAMMTIIVKIPFAIYVPNTFTPDGDGVNDYFLPQGVSINPDRYILHIFDRWGNLIFESTEIGKGWMGNVDGGDHYAQNDTYIWMIKVRPENSPEYLFFYGNVSIVR